MRDNLRKDMASRAGQRLRPGGGGGVEGFVEVGVDGEDEDAPVDDVFE